MIRLGTLFSGIGAIEQALKRMGLDHRIVFACDNGELELKLLPTEKQCELDKLKKIASYRLTPKEKERLQKLQALEQKIIQTKYDEIKNLNSIEDKNTCVQELYLEYSNGKNYVKETYLANYEIDESDYHLDVHIHEKECHVYQ